MPIVLIVIEFNLGEFFAYHEYFFSELFDAPWQCDGFKHFAACECVIAYVMHTFGKRYFSESTAVSESLGADPLKSLFDDQFFESGAAEE